MSENDSTGKPHHSRADNRRVKQRENRRRRRARKRDEKDEAENKASITTVALREPEVHHEDEAEVELELHRGKRPRHRPSPDERTVWFLFMVYKFSIRPRNVFESSVKEHELSPQYSGLIPHLVNQLWNVKLSSIERPSFNNTDEMQDNLEKKQKQLELLSKHLKRADSQSIWKRGLIRSDDDFKKFQYAKAIVSDVVETLKNERRNSLHRIEAALEALKHYEHLREICRSQRYDLEKSQILLRDLFKKQQQLDTLCYAMQVLPSSKRERREVQLRIENTKEKLKPKLRLLRKRDQQLERYKCLLAGRVEDDEDEDEKSKQKHARHCNN